MSREVIESGRLVLGRHHVDDAESYWKLWNDQLPGAAGVLPRDPEQAWIRLLRFVGHWHQFGFGAFLIMDKESRQLVGEAGYSYIPRGIGPHFDPFPQAGWNVGTDHRERGIAREAVLACTAWMDEFFPGRTVCMIHPGNKASMRVANTVGFEAYDEAEYQSQPVILYERTT